MSRKTVPILMVSIAALFIILVVIISFLLVAPGERSARNSRRDAVRTLLSHRVALSSDVDEALNLHNIALRMASPVSYGGSLDNLYHYLSKDPGRRDFSGNMDRRRAKEYLTGATAENAALYASDLVLSEVPPWAPLYAGTVRALFEVLRDDLLILTGVPQEITVLSPLDINKPTVSHQVETALQRFAKVWVPQGETLVSYSTDRDLVRKYLLDRRRFQRRLMEIDNSWKTLTADLYNLSMNPRWLTAVQYLPHLQKELDELIIITLTADIYWRNQDLLTLVHDARYRPGEPLGPGIIWSPIFSYYKNIPEVTGQTADEESTFFFAKVNLGYTFRDGETQTWLNRRKDWLTDYFSTFFSNTVREDFSPVRPVDKAFVEWKNARLKAEGIHGINVHIVASTPFGSRKVYGVRDLALVRVNLLANP